MKIEDYKRVQPCTISLRFEPCLRVKLATWLFKQVFPSSSVRIEI